MTSPAGRPEAEPIASTPSPPAGLRPPPPSELRPPAKAAIAGVKTDVAEAIEAAEQLLRLPASEEAYRSFVELLIPSPADHGEQISNRVRDNIAEARRSVRSVYEASPTCDAHRGSALGLVDAAFEYFDHLRGYRNRDSYLGRCLLKPEPLKAKAVQIAREVCTA